MIALKIIVTINACLMVHGTSVRGTSFRGAQVSSDTRRDLQTRFLVPGECTVANFATAVGSTATLAGILGVSNNNAALQAELDSRCELALNATTDLVDTLGKGPQFLKNFVDGGTTWNDNYADLTGTDDLYDLAVDAAVIPSLSDDVSSTVFGTPDGGTSAHYDRYFSNFYTSEKECELGVIECCYTSSRKSATGRTDLEDNAEMCALDLETAAKSNHIKAHSFTVYGTQAGDDTYCSGFAYEEDSFSEKVKYNTFFHMAMTTNLYENGFVKNIPGAPLCGCVEQMPIVDNAACVKVNEGYSIDEDGTVSIDISWEDCGTDLASYYQTLSKRSELEKYFVSSKIVGTGNCEAASASFLADQMMIPFTPVETSEYKTASNLLTRCPSGTEVSKEECAAAALALGGRLRNDKLVEGRWHHVAKGCSLQRSSGDIHYNTRSDARNTDHYAPVCKKV